MPDQSIDPVLAIRELLQRVEALEKRLQELGQQAASADPTPAPKRAKTGTNF